MSTSSTGGRSTESVGGSTGEPLDPALVAWYRFETTVPPEITDSSGNLLHGACVAGTCPVDAPGAIGGGGDFDGDDDIGLVAHDELFEPAGELTVAVWVRVTAIPPTIGVALGKVFADESANTWQLNVTPLLRPMFSVNNEEGQRSTIIDASVDLDTWFHMAMTWDGAVVRMYVDALEVGQRVAVMLNVDDGPLTMGADIDNGNQGFFLPAILDDARIYSRTLTEDEIADLAGM